MNHWLITPAYCKSAMLKELLKHLYDDHKTLTRKKHLGQFKHVIIDQHYPIADKYEHSVEELARIYGCIYIDSYYDRGLHRGVNNAIRVLDIQPSDIYIGCDPDDRPSPGSLEALADVMQADPWIAVAGLNFWVIPWKIKDHGLHMTEETIAGHRVWVHPGVEMFNVAAFNMALITELGGFSQPNAYYGGIEVALYHAWMKKAMKLVYLIDHTSEASPVDRNDPRIFDKEYGDWKIDHAHRGYSGSFAQWLRDRKKSVGDEDI